MPETPSSKYILDFSIHWILLGSVLSVFGFLPILLHGSFQFIVMGIVGLTCLATGIYGRMCRQKETKK